MKTKRIIYVILFIVLLITIFVFSSEKASVSEAKSDYVTIKAINIVSKITNKKISTNDKQRIVKKVRFLVRKTAHFSLYFVLNIFIYYMLKSFNIRHCFIYSILFCFLYACTDEIHQLYVYNREGRIFDVFVDTFGAVLSSIVIWLFGKISYYIKSNRQI